MNEIVFCISCGEMVSMECYDPFGCAHAVFIPIFSDNGQIVGVDSDLCEFPAGIATCPPQEEPDWIEHVVKPEASYDFDYAADRLIEAIDFAEMEGDFQPARKWANEIRQGR